MAALTSCLGSGISRRGNGFLAEEATYHGVERGSKQRSWGAGEQRSSRRGSRVEGYSAAPRPPVSRSAPEGFWPPAAVTTTKPSRTGDRRRSARGRRAAGGLRVAPRRRRQRRVVQPRARLVVHRRVALLQRLRPAQPGQPRPRGASRASRSSGPRIQDSTVWEVKLRPDVTWHDGKPFTADDVIYTFGEMADPKHVSHASVTNINLRDVRKVDDLTLEIPLKSPERPPLRLLRPAEHGDRPGRREGLHESRSAPAPSCSSPSRSASAASARVTQLLGGR